MTIPLEQYEAIFTSLRQRRAQRIEAGCFWVPKNFEERLAWIEELHRGGAITDEQRKILENPDYRNDNLSNLD